jgi:hypothetical protein
VSQLFILFGGLVSPQDLYEVLISQILFLVNIAAGLLLLRKRKWLLYSAIPLLILMVLSTILSSSKLTNPSILGNLQLGAYFLFYAILCYEINFQVWKEKSVNQHTLLGLTSGFISLGFISFFICISIETAMPNSYSFPDNGIGTVDNLMYFSFITIMSIGYGDIVPVTVIAQKSSLLIGLVGEIYLVIITAIVVGKYLKN